MLRHLLSRRLNSSVRGGRRQPGDDAKAVTSLELLAGRLGLKDLVETARTKSEEVHADICIAESDELIGYL